MRNTTMSDYFEPKYKGHYKRRCHDLMVEIWGESKEGTAAAYLWLGQNFGKQLHFKTENNEKRLKEIYTRLWLLSFNPPENPQIPNSYLKRAAKKARDHTKSTQKEPQPPGKKKLKKLKYGKVVQPRDLLREVAERNAHKPSLWQRFLTYIKRLSAKRPNSNPKEPLGGLFCAEHFVFDGGDFRHSCLGG